MTQPVDEQSISPKKRIPWFGAGKVARQLSNDLIESEAELERTKAQLKRIGDMSLRIVHEVKILRAQREILFEKLETLGALSVVEIEQKRKEAQKKAAEEALSFAQERSTAEAKLKALNDEIAAARHAIVASSDEALLQEVGIYKYRHPLTDAVSYKAALDRIDDQIRSMARKDGAAVQSITTWTVNGSVTEGRAMVRDFSKLMLRAFNAEADNLVRGLKPYKLDAALDRLKKVSETIERLGKTMQIKISPLYYLVRAQELELTADFLQKQAEEKEAERLDRERLREERKVQQEIERERARLDKERQHYANALAVLEQKGDSEAAERVREQLSEIDNSLKAVDFRAANIRAGYVYLISNIGSFGENIVKVGMTRRLDPMDRIKELSDASVPFNFDVHALFFSKDAVGIEGALHDRLENVRVNVVNRRREFFRATPAQVKSHLSQLAGELLQFQELPEALEYRQSITVQLEPSRL
ncbi:DUF4041 domain-containing protein [Pseudolabrys sp. FHR47]|uniref:DUF4041 domain-containing protein n=1 Tax=Pseudolabrys sp. FHR47 TaxID=2562284 RepID=UPI00197EC1AF|nr:DUF4041 domain-containing protein [Pseudolabrys sp. FHR47]